MEVYGGRLYLDLVGTWAQSALGLGLDQDLDSVGLALDLVGLDSIGNWLGHGLSQDSDSVGLDLKPGLSGLRLGQDSVRKVLKSLCILKM